jgi:hypothetical protein
MSEDMAIERHDCPLFIQFRATFQRILMAGRRNGATGVAP